MRQYGKKKVSRNIRTGKHPDNCTICYPPQKNCKHRARKQNKESVAEPTEEADNE